MVVSGFHEVKMHLACLMLVSLFVYAAAMPGNKEPESIKVQCTLTDENDSCPTFSSDEYKVTVSETIEEETDILHLFTTDRDVGDPHTITFRKKKNDTFSTDYLDLFEVREEFGSIYVKKNLISHTGTCRFTVQAMDNVCQGCTTNASVIVKVLQASNTPPFWIIPPKDNMTIYVHEKQYNGMYVYDVSAIDEDTGMNGTVEYSFIYDGVTTQATPNFTINQITGVIRTKHVYDREKGDKYVLLLKASDRGTMSLETTRYLTVVVLD